MRDETKSLLEHWVIAEQAVVDAKQHLIWAQKSLAESEARLTHKQYTLEELKILTFNAVKDWAENGAR